METWKTEPLPLFGDPDWGKVIALIRGQPLPVVLIARRVVETDKIYPDYYAPNGRVVDVRNITHWRPVELWKR